MSTLLTELQGVGPRTEYQLSRLNLHTVESLLFHLPLRYEDRSKITPIVSLVAGENALVEGTIQSVEIRKSKRSSLVCALGDDTGTIILRFFHFGQNQKQQFKIGSQWRCFGEMRQGYHCLELVHPEYQPVTPDTSPPVSDKLTPVYPSTEGLYQKQLRNLVLQALHHTEITDYLPEPILKQFKLLPLKQALWQTHYPAAGTSLEQLQAKQHPAQQRLAFEELLAHHLSLQMLRSQMQAQQAPELTNTGQLVSKLLDALPFSLTHAQERAYAEVAKDLQRSIPMQRLIQGDVGSGKTVVAALAALQAIESGFQVAVMAPTELLAEQHMHTFDQWLHPLGSKVTWLTGSLTKKQRQNALLDIGMGLTNLIVGTHALFQKDVEFAQLGLIIVDEQHRFGVHQRLALRNKGAQNGQYPHQLIMTATPIPRTLAMTAYADLDVSVIDELPPGRTPVNTAIIPSVRRDEIVARIKEVCLEGRQAYWVCPLIEESETLQLEAAEDTFAYLTAHLPDLTIGLVHGRMRSKEKEAVMQSFKQGNIHLLVATTVIEVGVDVPNASLMIIENAERLGLAQLHQLRGRVGRGNIESHCVLLYQQPLSELAQIRLTTIRSTHDGFAIAQRDLEIRGPGEVLGTKQTGLLNMRIANIERDQLLLSLVAQAGKIMLKNYPEQCQKLVERWVKNELTYGEV